MARRLSENGNETSNTTSSKKKLPDNHNYNITAIATSFMCKFSKKNLNT